MMRLNGPRVPKSYPKTKSKKSVSLKVRAAKGHNKGSDNPSTKVSEVTQKKVSRMSSNGPPRNYFEALKTNLKTCAKGTKLRVYIMTKGHRFWLV